jgi:hypothetical protein
LAGETEVLGENQDIILVNIYFVRHKRNAHIQHFWNCKGPEFDAVTTNVKIKEGFPAGIKNAYVPIVAISSATDSLPLLLLVCFTFVKDVRQLLDSRVLLTLNLANITSKFRNFPILL